MVDNLLEENNMIFYRNIILIFVFLFTLLILSNCGVSNPNSSNNSAAMPPNNIPTTTSINAYMSQTHQNIITAAAIDYLLRSDNPGKLSSRALYLLKTYRHEIEIGAAEEDAGMRPINHFWDPNNDRGLTDGGSIQSPFPFGDTARHWAENEYTSAKSQIKDIWSIYNSTSPTDIQKITNAMHTSGHVLHLFQDMASPAHVRNDSHLSGNPALDQTNQTLGMGGQDDYEYYVVQGIYTIPANSLKTININKEELRITNDNELWTRFRDLAMFTNHNFYSKDTIPTPTQAAWRLFNLPPLVSLPPLIYAGDVSWNGVDTLGKSFVINPLVYIIKNQITGNIRYTLNVKEHQAYADILVPKAVEYTASVLAYMLKDESKGGLYAIDGNGNTYIIDLQTYALPGGTIYTGSGRGTAVNDYTKKVYIADSSGHGITVIDASSNSISSVVPITGYTGGIDIDKYTNTVYVLDILNINVSSEVTVINGSNDTAVTHIPLMRTSNNYGWFWVDNAMAVNPLLKMGYIVNLDINTWVDYVSMINLNTYKEVPTTIPLSVKIPHSIEVNLNSKNPRAYISASFADNTYSYGGISIVDLTTNTEIGVIPLPQGMYGGTMTYDPNSNLLYVGAGSIHNDGYLYTIDCNTYQIIGSTPTNGKPCWLVVDPKSGKLYSGNQNWPSDSIDILSGGTLTLIKNIPIVSGLSGLAVLNLQ